MLLHLTRPLVVFDLETTGVNPRVDRIIEFGGVRIAPDGCRETFDVRINPGCPIPPEASAVHGITDADLADAPPFPAVAARIRAFLEGADFGGFNILRFDLPLLLREFADAGMPFDASAVKIVDAQRVYHMREPRDLSAALRFYCGEAHPDAHSAAADAAVTWQIIEGQCARYEDLPRTVAELDALCNPKDPEALDPDGKLRWRDDEVVLSFGQKSGTSLRELVANESSYLRWMLKKDFSDEAKTIVRNALDGRFPQRRKS